MTTPASPATRHIARIGRGASAMLGHRVLRNSLVYVASGVARNAIPFLLLPILTRYLSPADFGIVATFEVVLAMGLVFMGLNMYGAIAVNFFRLDRKELEAYVGNVILVSLLTSAGVFFISFGLVRVVALPFDSPTRWMPLLALAAFSQVLFSIALTLWQMEQRPIPYGLFQIAQTALNVALSLLLVIALGWGWEGRLLAIVIASAVFGALSLVVIFRRGYVQMTVRKDYIKDALSFGVPLIPHSLGTWILTGIDRIFLATMLGVAVTGVYTVGYQVGMIIGLLATSFNQAWSPFLFRKLQEDDPEARIAIVRFTYAYFPAIIFLALALSLVAPSFLEVFVGSEFQDAHRYVFWVAFGYAAYGMYLMISNYIYYAKKTHLLAWVTFFSAAVNVILNYVLIRANGAIGSAQASAASFLVSFLLTWMLSAKVCRMPWRVWDKGALADFRASFPAARA